MEDRDEELKKQKKKGKKWETEANSMKADCGQRSCVEIAVDENAEEAHTQSIRRDKQQQHRKFII